MLGYVRFSPARSLSRCLARVLPWARRGGLPGCRPCLGGEHAPRMRWRRGPEPCPFAAGWAGSESGSDDVVCRLVLSPSASLAPLSDYPKAGLVQLRPLVAAAGIFATGLWFRSPATSEPYKPTNAERLPRKPDSALGGFLGSEYSRTGREARLRPTEHPNAMPTSGRCPG